MFQYFFEFPTASNRSNSKLPQAVSTSLQLQTFAYRNSREKVYKPPKWFKTLRKTIFMESTNQQRHLKKSPRQLLSREFSKILMVSIQHYAWKWLFLFWILDYKSTITNMYLNKGILWNSLTKGMLFFDIWSKWF